MFTAAALVERNQAAWFSSSQGAFPPSILPQFPCFHLVCPHLSKLIKDLISVSYLFFWSMPTTIYPKKIGSSVRFKLSTLESFAAANWCESVKAVKLLGCWGVGRWKNSLVAFGGRQKIVWWLRSLSLVNLGRSAVASGNKLNSISYW